MKKAITAEDLYKILGNLPNRALTTIRIADEKGKGGEDVHVVSAHKEDRDKVPTLVICSHITWTEPKKKKSKVEADDDWTPEQEAAWQAFLATDCVDVCDAAPYFPE